MRMAPAASWRRAICTHLWTLACGRIATPWASDHAAIAAMFRSSAGRSRSRAGVGRSARGMPAMFLPCRLLDDCRPGQPLADLLEAGPAANQIDDRALHLRRRLVADHVSADGRARRAAAEGLVDGFQDGLGLALVAAGGDQRDLDELA